MRVLSRSLILWDTIEPTAGFVEGCCPALVLEWRLGRPGPEGDPLKPPADAELLRQAYVNIVAGACMAIGLK